MLQVEPKHYDFRTLDILDSQNPNHTQEEEKEPLFESMLGNISKIMPSIRNETHNSIESLSTFNP
jgi:hypothetical protein